MNLALKTSLEEMFARHETARAPLPRIGATAREKEARFLAAFMTKRDTVVRPVMEAVSRFLLTKGVESEIFVENDGVDKTGQEIEAKIGIAFIKTPRFFTVQEYPGLTIICEKRCGIVRLRAKRIWPGAGGVSAPAGSASLEDLTEALVEQELLKLLEQLFRS